MKLSVLALWIPLTVPNSINLRPRANRITNTKGRLWDDEPPETWLKLPGRSRFERGVGLTTSVI